MANASETIGPAPAATWAKTFGPDLQLANSGAVAIDAAGDVIVGGDFQDHIDLGEGVLTNTGAFIAKYDPSGNALWSKAIGGANSTSSAKFIAIDSAGDITVAGRFTTTVDFGGGPLTSARTSNDAIFVAKLDGSGNQIWATSFGDGNNAAEIGGMALDDAGGVVIVGTYQTTLTLGSSTLTPPGTEKGADFLAKLDAGSGSLVWSKGLPSTIAAFAALDDARDVFFVGSYNTASDFGCGTVTPVAGYDLVVVKLDPTGSCLWSKSYGSMGDDVATAIGVSSAGDAIFSGFAGGTINFGGGALAGNPTFIVDLDPTGALKWSKAFGGAVQIESVGADGTNGTIFGGSASDDVTYGSKDIPSVGGGADLFLLELDPSGALVWAIRDGTSSGASIQQISVDGALGTAIAGTARTGNLNVGTGPLACNGICAMVAKLAP